MKFDSIVCEILNEGEGISREERLKAFKNLKNDLDNTIRVGSRVRIKDDVGVGGWKGVVVGLETDEDDGPYGKMWEVEFDNGECEYVSDCDLDLDK
jgi:hypothetical protein